MNQPGSTSRKLLWWLFSIVLGLLITFSSFAASDMYGRFKEVERQCNSIDVIMEKLGHIQEDIKDIKKDIRRR